MLVRRFSIWYPGYSFLHSPDTFNDLLLDRCCAGPGDSIANKKSPSLPSLSCQLTVNHSNLQHPLFSKGISGMLWIRDANYDPQAKYGWPCFHQPCFIETPMSTSLCVVYHCFSATTSELLQEDCKAWYITNWSSTKKFANTCSK